VDGRHPPTLKQKKFKNMLDEIIIVELMDTERRRI